jgi:hypothetical protein|tara:strand:- start:22 stop:306 length:285 start_codon:yes stop_codon:yes gene_type:complete
MGDIIDFRTRTKTSNDNIIFYKRKIWRVCFTAPDGSMTMDRNSSNADIRLEIWTDESVGKKLGIAHIQAQSEEDARWRLCDLISVQSIDSVEPC